ncbi:MAG TPA: ABC transporter permease, partial [Herpetosiphonaceae bacterium]|nr:ABC transporter permease [Herpetosiphonaceae bacterium]
MAKVTPVVEPGTVPAANATMALGPAELGPQRTLWGDAWRRFRRHKLAMAGMIILLVFIIASIVGPWIYRVDREAIDFEASMSGSTLKHPFGTDDLGRDILARALFGGRISLSVGMVAMLISIGVGTTVGAVSGFFGGFVDNLLMRLTDLFLALPQLPLLLLTIYLFRDRLNKAFGPQLGIFILVVGIIGFLNWMPTARIVRASFLSLRQKEFVEAATCL